MSDDPTKTGQDRRTVSRQEHEIQHLKSKFHGEFPESSTSAIEEAIATAVTSTHQRDEVESKVREILNRTHK